MRKIALLFLLAFISVKIYAQGTLSGDLMLNANFFQSDTSIGAGNNPLYDNYLSGGEAWLGVRYNYKGFTAYVRADAFHNSNLYNPVQAMNGFGLGAWSLSKEYKGLTVTAGYIYDQIGSGILFRAYEDRGLLIDNALVGLELKYKLTDNINLKGFTGQQKNVATFGRYNPIIKGFNAEGDFSLGSNAHLLPGIGVLNRTLDQNSMDGVVSSINSQDVSTRFVPMYNTYAFTGYNTLTVGDFSWYIEGAYKTHEAIVSSSGLLVDKPGNVVYSTLGWAHKGIAVNLTGKRTENFVMRTSPNEVLIRGVLNWQPIVARLRPQRLMSRYTPASQDLSEQAFGADVLVAPNDNTTITLTGTYINTLTNVKLYREGYAECDFRGLDKWIIDGGLQYMQYNQELYQVKPGVPIITAITPFAEVTYRITSKHSIRLEGEYMSTKQDYGSWLFGLLEFNIAPKFSFAVSDMYNIEPTPGHEANHYYNIFTAYTKGPHRFTLAYVKQVDGINCTGGVCRYEPAFSGVKLGITSTF
ncbi:MAG: hypothetical protein BGO69_12090 [Bacteroidetes bacterium 46-16]|nr:MAG: hypothetical protein BGO69_12090 [Bacteroidetes bacterium 46-16]